MVINKPRIKPIKPNYPQKKVVPKIRQETTMNWRGALDWMLFSAPLQV